eukprot:364615-Chlamydomonas_euryale.AAC.11
MHRAVHRSCAVLLRGNHAPMPKRPHRLQSAPNGVNAAASIPCRLVDKHSAHRVRRRVRSATLCVGFVLREWRAPAAPALVPPHTPSTCSKHMSSPPPPTPPPHLTRVFRPRSSAYRCSSGGQPSSVRWVWSSTKPNCCLSKVRLPARAPFGCAPAALGLRRAAGGLGDICRCGVLDLGGAALAPRRGARAAARTAPAVAVTHKRTP